MYVYNTAAEIISLELIKISDCLCCFAATRLTQQSCGLSVSLQNRKRYGQSRINRINFCCKLKLYRFLIPLRTHICIQPSDGRYWEFKSDTILIQYLKMWTDIQYLRYDIIVSSMEIILKIRTCSHALTSTCSCFFFLKQVVQPCYI